MDATEISGHCPAKIPWGLRMRLVSAAALICAALSLALLGLRVGSAVSFAEPLQVVTSGWELSDVSAHGTH